MAVNHENAIGVISQSRLNDTDPGFIQMTPGVKMDSKKDSLGQQYDSPECAVLKKGADIIIVGRGITADKSPLDKAEEYRKSAWTSLLSRMT